MASTNGDLAKPLHIQRLERSLRLEPFLNHVEAIIQKKIEPSFEDSSFAREETGTETIYRHGIPVSKSERRNNKERQYNFSRVGSERAWLKDVLLSDTSEDEDENLEDLLELHKLRKKFQKKFHDNPMNRQYMYYSAGLLSKEDVYPDHKQSVLESSDSRPPKETTKDKAKANVPKKRKPKARASESEARVAEIKEEPPSHLEVDSGVMPSQETLTATQNTSLVFPFDIGSVKKEPLDRADSTELSFDSEGEDTDGLRLFDSVNESANGLSPLPSVSPTPMSLSPKSSPKAGKKKKGEKGERKGKTKKEKGKDKDKSQSLKALIAQRRKLWVHISKKEIGRAAKARVHKHKEELVSCKRAATACMRVCRLRAMQSQRAMKEIVWRAKRLTREMQSYWKRYDRVEKVQRRQAEKEAEEQRKLDVELMEARRQQRKLNFLITQTELYAHFMAKKLGHSDATGEQERSILQQLEEEKNPQLAYLDDYDSDTFKSRALANASTAFCAQQQRTQQFDRQVSQETHHTISHESVPAEAPKEYNQPSIFQGNLKTYQLKGMNWIANLYDQGINGILADEMGLGKTVQSIAFLAHVAERDGVWGPFLVISPASTLHNWQQEFARFVPDFKVIPYWGSPHERKILRKFWDTRNMHTPQASFHVVITSYQLIVTDYKYFNRIKWQYMVLDEAQAIKSSSSARWKLLLGFNCRSRLLLSGTPIQNSMAELWALLHFIMPTLFDSHEEFNEWFSKDIESHAENKTGIDEKHLSRLHMILKPFMLRRVKKDVENELSDKIEIMMYCPLTNRQKMLYQALKRKISIDDLLYSGSSSASAQSATTTLMNLVMQFRKVCNHPELFERREARSPFHFQPVPYVLPKLLYRDGLLDFALPSRRHLLYGKFYIWHPDHLHHSLFPKTTTGANSDTADTREKFASFTRFLGISPAEIFDIYNTGIIASWRQMARNLNLETLHFLNETWHGQTNTLDWTPGFRLSSPSVKSSKFLKRLVFTHHTSSGYAHLDYSIHSTPETIEHRLLRSSKIGFELPELPFTCREPQKFEMELHEVPAAFRLPTLKVSCKGTPLFCSDRSAAYWLERHSHCGNQEGRDFVWKGIRQLSDRSQVSFKPQTYGGLEAAKPKQGWSNIILPDKEVLISDAGKLQVLDTLLRRLKSEGHRVLIYSQMTRMIDLLEEYMCHRKWTYMRLDGSSKISERRDMVAHFQTRSDIFVFLLSTRAGGLGINLTAADTVIFYDSDWNPTVDQQAMDRAHRLGQTKQVTVYRLICKGSIEERILQRAREKSKIQKIVISGGSFKPDTLKPTEVVSLLLDDEEIERKYRQRQAEKKQTETEREADRKRKYAAGSSAGLESKKMRMDSSYTPAASPTLTEQSSQGGNKFDENSNDGSLVIDDSGPFDSAGIGRLTPLLPGRQRPRPGRGTGRRGRPPGSGKRGKVAASAGVGREAGPFNSEGGVGFLDSESVDVVGVDGSEESTPSSSQEAGASALKRRPGRPRLKPVGPANQGVRSARKESLGSPKGTPKVKGRRGAPPGPRIIKPLPVPIGSMASSQSDRSFSAASSPAGTPRPTGPGYYAPLSP